MNMNSFFSQTDNVPAQGYILEKWNQLGYRSTAYSYMKRENIGFVRNSNGETYSLAQIENALIGFKK